MARTTRSSSVRRRPRWLLPVAVGYAVPAALLVFWPTDVTGPIRHPLSVLEDLVPGGVAQLEFASNVVLFVPIGLLLALWLPRGRRWLAPVAGVLISFAIEMLQGALLPERYGALSDIIANSLGALLGTLLALIVASRNRIG